MGLGGDCGWGLMPHPEYLLPADRDYAWSLRLMPLA
jgi:beta-galactosidase